MALVEINFRPERRQLRVFGLAGAVILGAWAAWHGSMGVGWAAAVCAGIALAVPGVLRPVYVALSVVAWPIGVVVSYGVLAGLFYGLFTPVGVLFRLMGRDALQRRREPGASSYWIARRPSEDVERYFRQF